MKLSLLLIVNVALCVTKCLGASNSSNHHDYIDDLAPDINATEVLDEINTFLAENVDPRVVDGVVGAGIGFGILFAFFGARAVRFGSFIVGSVIGLVFGNFVANRLGEIDPMFGLGIVISSAASFGLLTLCMLKVAKVFIGIAFGLVSTGYLSQAGIVEAIGNDYLLWIMLGILLITCAVVSYFIFLHAVAACSALLGSAIYGLCLNHFLETKVSLRMIINDPKSARCADDNTMCWVVFGSSLAIFILGVLVQWRRLHQNRSLNQYKSLNDESKRKKVVIEDEDDDACDNKSLTKVCIVPLDISNQSNKKRRR